MKFINQSAEEFLGWVENNWGFILGLVGEGIFILVIVTVC